jgi:hypothetical protein
MQHTVNTLYMDKQMISHFRISTNKFLSAGSMSTVILTRVDYKSEISSSSSIGLELE